MNIVKHESYEEYVSIQIERSKKRTDYARKTLSWVSEDQLLEINKLIQFHTKGIKTIVCHGCRNGLEVSVFERLNPGAVVSGTDLYGKSYQYDRTNFRQMDFDKVPKEWIGYFDVVYSNSIDHSRDPINTLLAWKSELKENGICFVAFHWSKGELNKADCFGLSPRRPIHEIGEIAKRIGMKVPYVSQPYSVNKKSYSVNTILRDN